VVTKRGPLLLADPLTGVLAAPRPAIITPMPSMMRRCHALAFNLMTASVVLACTATAQTNTFPSSGSVGIGTTTPSYTLQISQPTGYNAWEVLQRPNAGQVSILGFLTGSTSDWALGEINTGSGTSDFGIFNYNTGANALSILKSNGSVGIGTTNPTAVLTTEPASNSSGFDVVANDGSSRIISLANTDGSNQGGYLGLGRIGAPITGAVADASVLLSGSVNSNSYFNTGGNVGIGTTNPTYPLSVNGTIEAKEVIVQTGWSDYVFDKGYHLAPLCEVERSIKEKKHLPGMPSAKEVGTHGVNLGDMQAKLLAQIEELALHQIEQEKRIDAQAEEIAQLRNENARLQINR